MKRPTRNSAFLIVAITLVASAGYAAESTAPNTRSESFDRDPGWEAFNNRVTPKRVRTVAQNFGFATTNVAGLSSGELGGRIWRAAKPAFYADKIKPLTLNDHLTASGSFALTKTTAGSGIFFGFFRAEQPGGGGRPVCSLGLDMDGEAAGARLAVRLITAKNQSCGTFITPFIPGKFRPTPIRNDGTRYQWKLDYDPKDVDGRGRFTFSLNSDGHRPGELEPADMPETFREEAHKRFPNTTDFHVDLPDGYRQQGTTFDHFGLLNMMKPGGQMAIYFDDLHYVGHSQDFASDSHWDASGNRESYQENDAVGAHDFGFSKTNYAGSKPGELGGTFWRGGDYGYYADRVGRLDLEDRLEAKGKVVLKVGAPDSDMYFGWFNSSTTEQRRGELRDFIGVHVGGPTRVGHYFLPALALSKGTRTKLDHGPVLEPNKKYEWSLLYDPSGANGQGTIRATLGAESAVLKLPKHAREEGARFDHFGAFTSTTGGQVVKIFLDDLTYTSAASRR